jgi:hypothetical protein
MPSETARRMTDAAGALLAALDPVQRAACAWPFPSDEERERWYYTPTDHGGVILGDLDPPRQQLVMALLRTGTSRAGYASVATIMGLENVLDELEDFAPAYGMPRGRDPSRYYLRIFGDPDGDRWSWRFGGHHVSVNHLVVAGEVAATTPFFLGANPATSPLLGPHLLRPLAGVEDLARDLVRSLDDERFAAALLSPAAPRELVARNLPRLYDDQASLAEVWRGRSEPVETDARVVVTREPRGVAIGAFDPAQRDLARALLHLYLDRVPDELAAREAERFAGDRINDVHLAWAGSTEPGRPHYYRLHGPRLWCEYDNTQDDANHIHTVWRDPAGDFGADVLAQHRAHDH